MTRIIGMCAALVLTLVVFASTVSGFIWPEQYDGSPRYRVGISAISMVPPGQGVPLSPNHLKTFISRRFPREIDTRFGLCRTSPVAEVEVVDGWRNYEYGVSLYCPDFAEYALKGFMEYQRHKHGAKGVNPHVAEFVLDMDRDRSQGTDLDLIPPEPPPWSWLDWQSRRDYEAYYHEQTERISRRLDRHFKAIDNGLNGEGW